MSGVERKHLKISVVGVIPVNVGSQYLVSMLLSPRCIHVAYTAICRVNFRVSESKRINWRGFLCTDRNSATLGHDDLWVRVCTIIDSLQRAIPTQLYSQWLCPLVVLFSARLICAVRWDNLPQGDITNRFINRPCGNSKLRYKFNILNARPMAANKYYQYIFFHIWPLSANIFVLKAWKL